MYSTDEAMSNKCEIFLYDVRNYESPIRWALFIIVCVRLLLCSCDFFFRRVVVDNSKVTAAVWGPLDEYIVTGHESGALSQYNIFDVCMDQAVVMCIDNSEG